MKPGLWRSVGIYRGKILGGCGSCCSPCCVPFLPSNAQNIWPIQIMIMQIRKEYISHPIKLLYFETKLYTDLTLFCFAAIASSCLIPSSAFFYSHFLDFKYFYWFYCRRCTSLYIRCAFMINSFKYYSLLSLFYRICCSFSSRLLYQFPLDWSYFTVTLFKFYSSKNMFSQNRFLEQGFVKDLGCF